MRTGAYPGSFNPPTVAHLAVAEAARRQGGLDVVEFVVSEVALGKEAAPGPDARARFDVLARLADSRRGLRARLTPKRLLVDIAEGYEALIIGADKWAQLVDPTWYPGGSFERDEALRRLPHLLVAPRPPYPLPPAEPGRITHLEVTAEHHSVSSSAVRAGQSEWMVTEAALSGLWGSPPGEVRSQ